MKNVFRTAALVSFVTLALTLFTAISASNQAEAARNFDPMAAYPAARLAASKITCCTKKNQLTHTQRPSNVCTCAWTIL